MNKKRVSVDIEQAGRIRRLANPFVGLDASVLRSYRGELEKLTRCAQTELERLAALSVMVNQAVSLNEQERAATLMISDHATLRWLERHGGVDMVHARSEIVAMVERGAPEVAVRDGLVVTVLPEGCESIESMLDEASAAQR